MKKVDVTKLTKEIHFPVERALPMKRASTFIGRIIEFFTFRRKTVLVKDYCLWCAALNKWIFLPIDFVYDGASVPKLLNSLYSSRGVLLLGSGPHDFGYGYQGLFLISPRTGEIRFFRFTKRELDHIFKTLNIWESGMTKAANIATFGLSLFGFTGWNKARKENRKAREDFPEFFITDRMEER